MSENTLFPNEIGFQCNSVFVKWCFSNEMLRQRHLVSENRTFSNEMRRQVNLVFERRSLPNEMLRQRHLVSEKGLSSNEMRFNLDSVSVKWREKWHKMNLFDKPSAGWCPNNFRSPSKGLLNPRRHCLRPLLGVSRTSGAVPTGLCLSYAEARKVALNANKMNRSRFPSKAAPNSNLKLNL